VKPTSRFGRALAELGVELIPAHSPQAKGRVERLFATFQDRLIKELRLAEIATLAGANRSLEEWLPRYNQRFAVRPAQAADPHRPGPAGRALDRLLCLKTTRVLRRDWTVAHNGHLYQIHDPLRATRVQVEERLDGTLRIPHHGRPLAYQAIATRPVRGPAPSTVSIPQGPVTPRPDHPWRKRLLPERGQQAAAARPATGHFYVGRKRTFLNWVDTRAQLELTFPSNSRILSR
jgi:hypothetical protein